MTALQRWRGLVALAKDAVEHGSRSVERVQLETAHLSFDVLERVPPLATPARAVRVVHDAGVAVIYRCVRLGARVAGAVVDAALRSREEGR